MKILALVFLFVCCLEVMGQSSPYDSAVAQAKSDLAIGRLDEALAGATQAIALDQSRWEAYTVAAGVLIKQHRCNEAKDYLQKAIARAPEAKKQGLTSLLTRCSADATSPVEVQKQEAMRQREAIANKELEEVFNTKIVRNPMPFQVRVDFVRGTGHTALVPVTVQLRNSEIKFMNRDGSQHGTVKIFGRVSTLTAKVEETFVDTVEVDAPPDLLSQVKENSSLYWKALSLGPGAHKIEVAVKDINGNRIGLRSQEIAVPDFPKDKLASSSLIVADQIVAAPPSTGVDGGSFIIGQTKVRPRVSSADDKPATFKHDQHVNFWVQVYNLALDETTHKPSAKFEYDVIDVTNNNLVIQKVQTTDQIEHSGDQVTLQQSIAAANLRTGIYKIEIKVNDNISKQSVSPSAIFAVE